MLWQLSLFWRSRAGVGNTSSETASNVLGGPRAKFGVQRDGIVAAYAAARAAGATRFGMHMMTGSNVRDVAYWEVRAMRCAAMRRGHVPCAVRCTHCTSSLLRV